MLVVFIVVDMFRIVRRQWRLRKVDENGFGKKNLNSPLNTQIYMKKTWIRFQKTSFCFQ